VALKAVAFSASQHSIILIASSEEWSVPIVVIDCCIFYTTSDHMPMT